MMISWTYNYNGAGSDYVNDLKMIRNWGVRKIRLHIQQADFTQGIIDWRVIVLYALSLGFEEVIWGLSRNPGALTASNIAAYNAAVHSEALWCQQQNNPRLTLCIGNEETFHRDGTLTDAQVRANARVQYADAKATYNIPGSHVIYTMANGEMFPFFQDFTNSGLSYPWDYPTANQYTYPTGQSSATYFYINLSSAIAWFGANLVITEVCPSDSGYSESLFKDKMFYTEQFVQNFYDIADHGIKEAYAYNFQDASFGAMGPDRIFRPWLYAIRDLITEQ